VLGVTTQPERTACVWNLGHDPSEYEEDHLNPAPSASTVQARNL